MIEVSHIIFENRFGLLGIVQEAIADPMAVAAVTGAVSDTSRSLRGPIMPTSTRP